MHGRPLCMASLMITFILMVFTLVGMLPKNNIPLGEASEILIDSGRQIWIEGVAESAAKKEKTLQIILKKAQIEADGIFPENKENAKDSYGEVTGKILVSVRLEQAVEVPEGSSVRVFGTLQSLEKPGNPGQFDSVAYYLAKGIGCRFWCEEMKVIEETYPSLTAMLGMLRKRAVDVFREQLPDRYAGILSTMLLGDKSMLEEETKTDFQWSSLLHLLSISGMHVSLLGMGVFLLLRRAYLPNSAAAVLAGVLIGFYCILTGNGVATLRAYIMFLVSMGARICGRSYDCASSMSLSILLLLFSNHFYLYYSGFQMSLAAVAGAGIVYPILKKYYKRKHTKPVKSFLQKRKQLLKDNCLVCVAITITTLPLVAYYYSEIPVYGVFVNMLLLPTVGLLMGNACLGLFVGIPGYSLSSVIAKIVFLPVHLMLFLYEKVMQGVRMLPGAMWICGQPEVWQMVSYYVILVGILIRISRIDSCLYQEADQISFRKKFRLFLAVIPLGLILFFRMPVALSITALDVGQGDCIALRSYSHAWLVDGGSSSITKVGTYRIEPYLKSQGIRVLDGIFVTHPDNDHMNGILELLTMIQERKTAVRVRNLFLPIWMKGKVTEEEFHRLAKMCGIPVTYVQRGDSFTSGKMFVEVLHPGLQDYSQHTNEGSVTLGIHEGGFDALLTGDLEKSGELEVIPNLKTYEYLKCGHHGSKYASQEAFLAIVQPEIAVISCGKNNRYGHPHKDVLARLEATDSDIYRTDQSGAVCTEVRRGKIYVRGFH